MSETAEVQWIEPYAGYQFEQRQMTVEAAEQARLLDLCGIDPALFGDCMDPAGFISLAIREGVRNRIHANGTVNMVNSLMQRRPVRLGEPLTISGEVLAVKEVPRGRVATSEVWVCGTDGDRALTSLRSSLRPDPAKAGTRGAGERPAAVVDDPALLSAVATYTLKPEQVKAYGGPHNPIHVDPAAAQRAGFRAPIIGGGQGVRFITAEIWKRFRPQVLELDCYFRRPIYWDDTFTVMVDERAGEWRAICLAKDGKVATEARINRLSGTRE
jgi:acyl dehydratase